MLVKSLAFLTGLCSLFLIQSSRDATEWLLAASILFVFSIVLRFLFKNYAHKIGLLILFFSVGVIWASTYIYYWSEKRTPLVSSPIRTTITGSICGIPALQQKHVKFEFCVEAVSGKKVDIFTQNRLIASWRSYSEQALPKIKAGERWRFNVKVKPPHGLYNPGNFDQERWMLAYGFTGKANIRSGEKLTSGFGLTNYYHSIRQEIYDRVLRLAQEKTSKKTANQNSSESNIGLLLAITLGEKQLISDAHWLAFKNTGTSHLLAISGLHIGIAALWSYWLFSFTWRVSKRLCLVLPAQTVGQIGSLIGAYSLLLLSGFGLPAIRATLMLTIFILAKLFSRRINLSRVLGLVILLVSIISPYSILSASFWLSFFAVFVISIVINRQFQESTKLVSWLKVNWYLYLLLIPITLLFFGYFNIAAIVANLLLIPLVSFVITPLCFITVIAVNLWQNFGEVIFYPLNLLLEGMTLFQAWLSGMTWLGIYYQPTHLSLLLLLCLIGLWTLPRRLCNRLISVPLAISMLAIEFQSKDKHSFEMFVFDIGQGLAIFIETKEHRLLYDTGWGNAEFSLAKTVLIPFFESREVSFVDKLVVSHGDSDHSGGIKDLMSSLRIGKVVSGEDFEKFNSVSCHEYPAWQWDEIDFSFYSHINRIDVNGNNASCVLSVKIGKKRILLTGDIERSAELRLLENGIQSHDLVVAPHHGSKTSSTTQFVERINPNHVIFSTGYANQWDFPRLEVLERYNQIKSKIWTTHLDGAIRIWIDSKGELNVESWRNKKRHFWALPKKLSAFTN